MNFIDLRNYNSTKASMGAGSPWVSDSAHSEGLVGPEEKTYNYIRGKVREIETHNDLEKKCAKIDSAVLNAVSRVNDAVEKKNYSEIFDIVSELREGVEDVIQNHHDPYYSDIMEECYATILIQLYECEHGSVRKMLSGKETKLEKGRQHLIEVIYKYGESVKEFLERFRRIRFKTANVEDDSSSHELSKPGVRTQGSKTSTSCRFRCSY